MKNLEKCSCLSEICPMARQIFLLSSFFIMVICIWELSQATQTKTALQSSTVQISCGSSTIPPFWSFQSPKQNQPKTLAFSGTQPHPDLKDSRFSFSRSESAYILTISDVQLNDAGTYNCQGDKVQQTVLNIIR